MKTGVQSVGDVESGRGSTVSLRSIFKARDILLQHQHVRDQQKERVDPAIDARLCWGTIWHRRGIVSHLDSLVE